MQKTSIAIAIIDNGMGLCYADHAFAWVKTLLHPDMRESMEGRDVHFLRLSYAYPGGALNIVTDAFMAGRCEKLVIVDMDHDFGPFDFLRLISHDLPIVSGLYTKKHPVVQLPFGFTPEHPISDDREEKMRNPLVEVEYCPRGFIAIHRSVFETMQPYIGTIDEIHTGKKIYDYWHPMPNGHSEDFAFCKRWREMDGKIYVDQRIMVSHLGTQRFPLSEVDLREAVAMFPAKA